MDEDTVDTSPMEPGPEIARQTVAPSIEKTPREPGIIQLISESTEQLNMLYKTIRTLEERLNPIMLPLGSDSGESAKEAEKDASRPDALLRKVNMRIRRANTRLVKILDRLNI